MGLKTYCSCKKNDYVTRGLTEEGPTFLGEVLFVCATCCLPHRLVWEAYLRKCSSCLTDKCLPWEETCQSCFKEEHGTTKNYHGLLRASKTAIKRLSWPLPKTEIRQALGDKPLQHKGSEAFGTENSVKLSQKLGDTI